MIIGFNQEERGMKEEKTGNGIKYKFEKQNFVYLTMLIEKKMVWNVRVHKHEKIKKRKYGGLNSLMKFKLIFKTNEL